MLELRNEVYKKPEGTRPTKIVASAILVSGNVWTGKRHYQLIQIAHADTGCYVRQREQGFWTDDGRFLMREAALTLAIRTGQIKKENLISKTLTSEDLW